MGIELQLERISKEYKELESMVQQDQSTLWSLSASNALKCNAILSNAKQCNSK